MKYYKITNEEETRHDLIYHDGLNIDPRPFDPTGDCQPGGIYFAREHILCFLSYGPWLREVTLPEDARVYENPEEPMKWKADKVILGPRERITAEVVGRLIEEGADLEARNSEALRLAATNGHLEIVGMLLPFSDPSARDSGALCSAATNGHLEIVGMLLPFSDPKASDSEAFCLAAANGHLEIVGMLLPFSDPKALDSYALRSAAANGHLEIVRLLLPLSDPKARDSEAFRRAAACGHIEIVRLLLPRID